MLPSDGLYMLLFVVLTDPALVTSALSLLFEDNNNNNNNNNMIIIIIIMIIISIFKEDNVFNMNANLPYCPPLNTDIGYLQAFC